MKHSIELSTGYTTKDRKTQQDVTHREVEFGKRLTAQDLMNLDNDPQGQNPTQYAALIRRKMITKFGTLTMPVPLNVLIDLDFYDREKLEAAADQYLVLSREERTSEIRPNHEVKLMFGFNIDGTVYDVATFGNVLTGRDEVEADTHGTSGVARECFLIGRQISRLSTDDGVVAIDGPVNLEKFLSLDAEDLNLLRVGAEFWKAFFRQEREKFQKLRNAGDGLHLVTGNGDVGVRDTINAD